MERVQTAPQARAAVAAARSRGAAVDPRGAQTRASGERPQRPADASNRNDDRAAAVARIALVPTMGYLHEGHLALIDRAHERADSVVVSVFVNPLQFGPGEDLDRYPRDLERDAALIAEHGADLLFAPSAEAIYPAGEPAVLVSPGHLADRLCGAFRPGHFQGVLTVVLKLFNIVRPDIAVFGQKDYQQALLIRRMVTDLDLPIEIDVVPTVREQDGLARSSRNLYLGPAERARAAALYRGLGEAEAAYRAGQRDGARLSDRVRAVVEAEPGVRVQYVELVHPDTLAPVEEAAPGSVLAIAAFVGATRLIDNLILPPA